MTLVPVLGSTLGKIFAPLFEAVAWILAFFYALVPNYVFAIGMLTLTIMVLTAPLTVKSTRSMAAMQKLQPQMKKLQQKYKGDKVTLNEEMMKLYRENHVNPAGGCLPMLLQFPIFIVLYDVIQGLTNAVHHAGRLVAEPRYISHNTRIYRDLVAHPGQMKAFGLNLASDLFSHHTPIGYIPYALMVAVAIALQYLQMRQMTNRNPAAAQANPQMQAVQKYMPLIFAIIYLRIAAGVNVYFIVSSASRIGIQEWVFRSGMLDRPPRKALAGAGGSGRRSLMDRIAEAQQRALEQQRMSQQARGELGAGGAGRGGPPSARPTGARPPAKPSAAGGVPGKASAAAKPAGGSRTNGDGSAGPAGRGGGVQRTRPAPAAKPDDAAKEPHPRSKAKKSRKAR